MSRTQHLGILLALLTAFTGIAEPTGLVIEDFEAVNFVGWVVDGSAFGDQPVAGNVGRQTGITGIIDSRFANSFHGDDRATGKLKSAPFVIKRNTISFMIAGGNHPNQTCLDLIIDDKVVRTATGNNDPKLRRQEWNVSDLIGEIATLTIRDNHSGQWGWIGVDHIVQDGSSNLAAAEPAPDEQVPEESTGTEHIKTDPDFLVNHFAGNDLVNNPIALTTDEKGRVFVAEVGRFHRGVEDTRSKSFWMMDELAIQSTGDRLKQYDKWIAAGKFEPDHFTRHEDRIVRLVDEDGDGVADDKSIFADGFNAPLDGNGSSILYDNGNIYYTSIPNLWLIEDADGDGVSEKRTSLQEGFGLRSGVNGHDMHGLEWGPDGKVYWSIGDRGYNITTKEGLHLKDAEAGAVFRCDPDGSNIELFCSGNRNPQDLAFDQYGDLFTVDNNRGRGDRSRLSYLIEGGDYGWNSGYENLVTFAEPSGFNNTRNPRPAVAWTEEGLWKQPFDGQPAHVIPSIDFIDGGSCGITFVPGSSLGDKYANHMLFSGYQRGIISFALATDGAGFKMVDYKNFWTGGLIIDTEFSPKGELYVADYVATRNATTGTKGDVYRLTHPEAIEHASVTEAAKLLSSGFSERKTSELTDYLGHQDQRVRLKSQFELAARNNAVDALLATALTPVQLFDEAKQDASPDQGMMPILTEKSQGRWDTMAIGPPSATDFADRASSNGTTITYAKGDRWAKPHEKSGAVDGMLPRLIDGSRAKNNDDVTGCVWFDGNPARIVMSFTEVRQITQVHTYSWHKANRAPQRFVLYGSAKAAPKAGSLKDWIEVGRVDTSILGDGGQHGSLVRNPGGNLGLFQHLMWATENSKTGTFFTELDVYTDTDDAPSIGPIQDLEKIVASTWKPETFNGPLLARIHAIWALGQMGRRDPSVVKPLISLLNDPYYRIRAQTARTLGNLRAPQAGPALSRTLSDKHSRVRGFAASALGKTGYKKGLPALIELIKETKSTDPFLRHQAIYGLEQLNNLDAVTKYAKSDSTAVRLAVQQVLRRVEDPRVKQFLNDEDPRIVQEAMRAIHDKRIDAAEPALAAKLRDFIDAEENALLPTTLSFERMMNANVRQGQKKHLDTLVEIARSEFLPEDVRVRCMNWLGRWPSPHVADLIIGQLREVSDDRVDATEKVSAFVEQNIDRSEGKIRSAFMHLANVYGVPLNPEQLQAQALMRGADRMERLQALEALLQNPTKELTETLASLSADPDQFVRIVALQALAERDSDAALSHVEKFLEDGTVKDMQTAYGVLGSIKTDRAAALLVNGINELIEGRDLAAALEVVSACSQREEPEVKAALNKYKESLSPEDKLADFRTLLDGGDVKAGEEVLQNHGTAQCIICHNVKGKGGVVAPDLAKMGTRAEAEYLLESLVLPSESVVPGFGNMSATLNDGSTIVGSLLEETETELVLKMPDGTEKSVPKATIKTRTNAISSMPPMTAMLKKHEIRDVIAYLKSLNKPKKKKGH